jgi:hypothetical protein
LWYYLFYILIGSIRKRGFRNEVGCVIIFSEYHAIVLEDIVNRLFLL